MLKTPSTLARIALVAALGGATVCAVFGLAALAAVRAIDPSAPAQPRPGHTDDAPSAPEPYPPRPPHLHPTGGPSRAVGIPSAGRLEGGVPLPAGGTGYVTWDEALETKPNTSWRRYGTRRLVRFVRRVLREYARAHPGAPRVAVGDLSLPRGGRFGRRYGGLGHRSHQNGLDVDVYYPRRDRAERPASAPAEVDRRLAQDLVNRFVEAGAVYAFVGPSLRLRGPTSIVIPLKYHDDHVHVRIAGDHL